MILQARGAMVVDDAGQAIRMSGHHACLRCRFLSGCTLLHFGLSQILAVYRDIGPTLGARKDGLVPLVLQRCCGPCMWRALLSHVVLTSTDA